MESKFTQLNCDFDRKSYEKLNSQFSKVKIRIAYDGLNRNGSIIPKDVLNNMSKTSLLNIPIVGEYSEEKKNFLGHGGKLEISDEGFKFIDTTRPYGVVPSDTEVYWEKIMDKNGYDEHEYLCCTGILWHGRYPEIEKILDDGANQSMELQILDAEYTEDSKFLIKNAEFSALCVLGKDDYHSKDDPDSTNVEPCFEDACISRYSSKDFKEEFSLMLDQYKKFNLSQDSLDINIQTESQVEESFDTNYKEEDKNLAKGNKEQLDQEKVNAKLSSVISENKYRSTTDKHYTKYEILSNTDSVVDVLDREDGYKIYSIPYLATETNDGIIVNIDYEKKEERSFGIVDKTDNSFSIKKEVDMISDDTAEYKVSQYSSNTISTLTSELEEMTENYSKADKEIRRLTEQLGVFQKEKDSFMVQKHKESVDTFLSSKRDEMGHYSKFLDYCIDPDYSKTLEQIENEVKEIRYEFLDSTSKNKKSSFSAIETTVIRTSDKDDIIAKIYGPDIAKHFNK